MGDEAEPVGLIGDRNEREAPAASAGACQGGVSVLLRPAAATQPVLSRRVGTPRTRRSLWFAEPGAAARVVMLHGDAAFHMGDRLHRISEQRAPTTVSG